MNSEDNLIQEKPIKQKTQKSACYFLIFICIFMYVSMMGAKNLYTAEIIEIIDAFGSTRAKASMANTLYYITYAAVQIVLFFCFDKLNLKRFLSVTIAISAINIVVTGFVTDMWQIWLLFAVNGCLQAGGYAGIMLIFAKNLPYKYLAGTNRIVSSSGVAANVLSFGFATVSVSFFDWRFGFYVLGGLFVLSVLVFAFSYSGTVKAIKEREKEAETACDNSVPLKAEPEIYADISGKNKKVVFYAVVLVEIFLFNALHFAVNNWFSDILYNVYNIPKNYSMLITIVVPMVILLGPIISIGYTEKHPDVLRGALLFASVTLIFPLYMIFFYDLNVIATILVLLIYLILINGGRIFFSSIMAFRMRKVLNAGSYSAITNASASVAAGVAPTVVGFIADLGGWGVSFLSLFVINAVLALSILVAVFIFKKLGITK